VEKTMGRKPKAKNKPETITITVKKGIGGKGYRSGTYFCSSCQLAFDTSPPINLPRCPYCNKPLRRSSKKPKKEITKRINPLLYLDDLDLQ
jgi:predicted amidophosphoribosyltransferase